MASEAAVHHHHTFPSMALYHSHVSKTPNCGIMYNNIHGYILPLMAWDSHVLMYSRYYFAATYMCKIKCIEAKTLHRPCIKTNGVYRLRNLWTMGSIRVTPSVLRGTKCERSKVAAIQLCERSKCTSRD